MKEDLQICFVNEIASDDEVLEDDDINVRYKLLFFYLLYKRMLSHASNLSLDFNASYSDLHEDLDIEDDNDFKSLHYNLYVGVPMLDY